MLDTKEAAEDLKTFYLVGAANSGKSSLLNRISMRKRRGLGKTPVHEATGSTVSALPGTTLSNMAVRYERNRVGIVDTPGLLMPGGLASKLPYGDLLQTVPQKGESIRLSIGIEEKQTIMIGGLGRIDLVEGERKQFPNRRRAAGVGPRIQVRSSREGAWRVSPGHAGRRGLPQASAGAIGRMAKAHVDSARCRFFLQHQFARVPSLLLGL
ncbi:unnamed protein product [Prorocentrum cordatum]|uniref:G domain-containing protein n=1 Tax=Prorocentrum cordatum TaxID=2364126 RepID=A0ABN9V0B0_9DINO|nr:unnamed protein product [Polarella glacialis]